MEEENFPVECHPKIPQNMQECGCCPEDKCLLDCVICNPNLGVKSS